MTEKELIGKIRELRRIQPRKDWVLLTKNQILGNVEVRPQPFLSLFFKPAYAGLIVVFAFFGLLGVFGATHYSLPGDFLWTFKKVIEKGQAVFVSEAEKPQYNLKMAAQRLEELNKISRANQVENLAPALKEFKATKVAAKKKVLSAIKNKSHQKTIKIAKEIAPKLIELDKKEKEVYATLDIEPTNEGTNETAEKALTEVLIKEAKKSTLTEEQAELLAEAEEYYNKGEYQEALIKILESSPK
ncbi:hypothetical protein KJ636_02625 [Patescibacteria group bacterium]|nr:hypothetical protein [Patescibacteria group bacterium]